MNEIRILYFGSAADISSSLLYLLNVVEVRPATEVQNGFFLFETRFGQESVRPLSLDATDTEAKDVLIYRYLSDREKLSLQDHAHSRRFFVLLHNFFNLDYIAGEIQGQDHNQFNFLVEMSNNDFFKPFAYASRMLPSKNFYRIAKVRTAEKHEKKPGAAWHLPVFLLVIFKFLMNPINEVKRLAIIAKHSNLRVLSRGLELVLFVDFVLRAVVFHTFRMLGLQLFYKSSFFAGVVRVVSIKSAFFFRHVVLMSGYKLFGFGVDAFNLLVRLKDIFVTTVYYRLLHRFYFQIIHRFYFQVVHRFYFQVVRRLAIQFYFQVLHRFYFQVVRRLFIQFYVDCVQRIYFKTLHVLYHGYIKKFANFVVYKVVLAFYYWALPRLNSARLFLRYNVPHAVTMFYYRVYGLAYDFATFSYRFTFLVLLYPVRKIYWFSRFQYEKRLKKYLL